MIREILKEPNEQLKEVSKHISRIEDVNDIVKDMFDTCEANNGCLAAN